MWVLQLHSGLHGLAGNQPWLQCEKPEEDFIALPGQGEILFGDSLFFVRGERQRDLIKTNINIRVMIELLSIPGDAVDKGNAA